MIPIFLILILLTASSYDEVKNKLSQSLFENLSKDNIEEYFNCLLKSYELTKELETIYSSYSTWSGWYPIIIANGENIEDYFDILWQKYDYYY